MINNSQAIINDQAHNMFYTLIRHIYLENINLILAFIINIISQSIEHLNIIFLNDIFNTIDVYTAIKLNWLSVAFVAQWVEHVNIAHLHF